jgi:hypothetical protein
MTNNDNNDINDFNNKILLQVIEQVIIIKNPLQE